jgi:hypothetical protein
LSSFRWYKSTRFFVFVKLDIDLIRVVVSRGARTVPHGVGTTGSALDADRAKLVVTRLTKPALMRLPPCLSRYLHIAIDTSNSVPNVVSSRNG